MEKQTYVEEYIERYGFCWLRKLRTFSMFKKNGELIIRRLSKEQSEISQKSYERWYHGDRYKVFELGTGEYRVMEKPDNWSFNWRYLACSEYFKTIEEACDIMESLYIKLEKRKKERQKEKDRQKIVREINCETKI